MSGDPFDTAKIGDYIEFTDKGVEVSAARPDVVAIVQIDEIMRGLSAYQQHAVIAWFNARTRA